jgi:PD-(D/E)XK endonuclease
MKEGAKPGSHRRERAVNRRIQGDLGEISAMEWLTAQGALVWIPMGHSPHVDLMAQFGDRFVRVQVKTSTCQGRLRQGDPRWRVAIATSGGNQSWGGTVKRFDPEKVDYLFVLVGDGRRWFIPAPCVEARRMIGLGGSKYSEFEVESGTAIDSLIYPDSDLNRISPVLEGECQSGQMDLTVNQAAMPTQVRILPPPYHQPAPRFSSDRNARRRFPRRPARRRGFAPAIGFGSAHLGLVASFLNGSKSATRTPRSTKIAA